MSLSVSPNFTAYRAMSPANFKARRDETPKSEKLEDQGTPKNTNHKMTGGDIFLAGLMAGMLGLTGYAGVTCASDMYKWHKEKQAKEIKLSDEDLKFYESIKDLSIEEQYKKTNDKQIETTEKTLQLLQGLINAMEEGSTKPEK